MSNSGNIIETSIILKGAIYGALQNRERSVPAVEPDHPFPESAPRHFRMHHFRTTSFSNFRNHINLKNPTFQQLFCRLPCLS